MKALLCLFPLLGLALAQRQPARDVISKFREVAPKYMDIVKTGETNLEQVQGEARDMMSKFHNDMIRIKESYVVAAIRKESEMHGLVTGQADEVDRTCLGFLNTTLDMSMDLAGAGFTNCINNADESFNGMLADYLNATEVQEALLNEIRLLDVFRGDNVFYQDSPYNIINKLDKKLDDMKINPESLSANLETVKEKLNGDLESIRFKYVLCMTQAEQLLNSSVDVIMAQLTFSCLGSVL
ncbi:AAEL013773-PA [Aedes aegypti]|uniref:AAEL013773-PA n=1 Tax=Aedes aegypti TaxID=7159 RepID=Q16I74_AEDAE|nr:AAEL013773-PA [Aedes aegypti]